MNHCFEICHYQQNVRQHYYRLDTLVINISYNIVTDSGITDSPYYLQCDWWNSNLQVLVLLVIVIGPSRVYNSGSNHARNFKIGRARSARPIWNYEHDYSLNCIIHLVQSTVRKKMAAVHFTTIPCEPNLAHLANGKIWFNGSPSYTNSMNDLQFPLCFYTLF